MRTCKGCGERIRWVQGPRGRMTALDADAAQEGRWLIVDHQGGSRMEALKYDSDMTLPRYTIHSDTCVRPKPQARS